MSFYQLFYLPFNIKRALIAMAKIKIVIATNSRLTALSNPVVIFAILSLVAFVRLYDVLYADDEAPVGAVIIN